ncbi:hypothetical protein Micbo1qcDRAFT_201175 [Microdochium bolleyi]|uniref:Uncharacterized protein n=1 Tax=Microdochium bolleyi TaxID=196109 RepID=A0A136JGI7_9PEZI|nr:hypothetical protein Micbo1qcDRAFT_201175 [Microdochium bolleyi]
MSDSTNDINNSSPPDNRHVFPPIQRRPVGSRSPGTTGARSATQSRTPPPPPPPPPPLAALPAARSTGPKLSLPLRINTSVHNERLPRSSPEQVQQRNQHETPYRQGDENSGYYNEQQRHDRRQQRQEVRHPQQHQQQHQHQGDERPTRPVRDRTPRRGPPPRPRRRDAREQDETRGRASNAGTLDRTTMWPTFPSTSSPQPMHTSRSRLLMTDSRHQHRREQQQQWRPPLAAPVLTAEPLQNLSKAQPQQPVATRTTDVHATTVPSNYDNRNSSSNNDDRCYNGRKNNDDDLDSNGVSPLSCLGSDDDNDESWREYVVSPVSSVSSPRR